MTHNETYQYEDITRLIKKIEWPNPDDNFLHRMQCAAGTISPVFFPNDTPWFIKSPLLSCIAVTLALLMGIGSGTLTSVQATAMNYSEPAVYGVSHSSIAKVYFAQSMGNAR
jgi:hypothetical protein